MITGRDRSTHESSVRSYASCLDPDHDERVWTGDGVIEEGSEGEGCHNGAQALAGERLK